MSYAHFLSPITARIKWSIYLTYWIFFWQEHTRRNLKACLAPYCSRIIFDTLCPLLMRKLFVDRSKKLSRTPSWRSACLPNFLLHSLLIKRMLERRVKYNSSWMSSSCKKLPVSTKTYYKLYFLWPELHKRFATHAAPYGLIISYIFYTQFNVNNKNTTII